MRKICDETGILLIADEIMAGFGRCGKWFAVQHWGVTSDLITFAKGVNSGNVPLGGVVISNAVAATFDQRAVPGRAHLLRPPARMRLGHRVYQHLQGGGASSTTPDASAKM